MAAGTLAAAAIAMLANGDKSAPSTRDSASAVITEKRKLALLTSLPILFGERFGLNTTKSPLLIELAKNFDVQAINVADRTSLKPFGLLLMAHPRAQPAEALVDLDTWVRGGGSVLLLADPRLDWHTDRPLGDKLRPPPDFADTGLLDHWGLRLAGPTVDGPAIIEAGGLSVLTSSPGRLSAKGDECKVDESGLIARCSVGRGSVTVIADADFLNVVGLDALDGPTDRNLSLLSRELQRLAH